MQTISRNEQELFRLFQRCREDWRVFAQDVLEANLDAEQLEILHSFQHNWKTVVCSGNGRGKDYCAAVCALCFLYLTPERDKSGKLTKPSKVFASGPTDRQVQTIVMPEIARLFSNLQRNGFLHVIGGKMLSQEIRFPEKEIFFHAFKADDNNTEAWTGLHAPNIAFIITEASDFSEKIFNAIEGNLTGNSRLLLVFNDNNGNGYAHDAMNHPEFTAFRLDSLNAPNVVQRRTVIPGQVDHRFVDAKVKEWCTVIPEDQFQETEGDFHWFDEESGETRCYRPNDLFRVKIRGMAPKVSSDVLVPMEWIEAAWKRWREQQAQGWKITKPLRLGGDVAGMGRDSSCLLYRFGDYVEKFQMVHGAGTANHMEIAGRVKSALDTHTDHFRKSFPSAFVDTIGEGAGVFSRLEEQAVPRVYSVKFSAAPEWNGQPLKDRTGQYEFTNLRAYLYWAVRDWLDPSRKDCKAMLPPDKELAEELSGTKWKFESNGKIRIEPKDEIKKRIKRSPDKADALAMTFYPVEDFDANPKKRQDLTKLFY